MQNLDNHMDDLFKKAAEDYPLKIQPGNFDSVLPFVGNSVSVKKINQTRKSSRTRNLSLLAIICLLLPTVAIIWQTNKKLNPVISQSTTPQDKPNENALVADESKKLESYNKTSPLPSEPTNSTSGGIQVSKNLSASALKQKQDQSKLKASKGLTYPNRSRLGERSKWFDLQTQEHSTPSDEFAKIKFIPKDKSLTEKAILIEEPALSSASEVFAAGSPKLTKNRSQKFAPSVYYGGVLGIEMSSVSLQGMNRTTFNGGLSLGLQVNKRIALESAVILSQKKYYSEGKYFKPKAGSMPSNMVIRSLTSSINVIELPISVKYDFTRKFNGFYSKLGLSSFILTKENNNYKVLVAGQEQQIKSLYQTNHSYFASSVRIAVGFQKQYSKNLKLRLEPYLQIPVKGMGVGSMSVTSAGLQLFLSNR